MSWQDASVDPFYITYIALEREREREKDQRTVNKERRAKPSAKCVATTFSLAPAVADSPGKEKVLVFFILWTLHFICIIYAVSFLYLS